MSLKSWILQKMNGLTTRVDLPRSPVFHAPAADGPSVLRRGVGRSTPAVAHREAAPVAADLGPYAPLIAAIRDELAQFVVSYLRLHLTIAERDRYLLTSIDVRATTEDDDSGDLLRRFTREFNWSRSRVPREGVTPPAQRQCHRPVPIRRAQCGTRRRGYREEDGYSEPLRASEREAHALARPYGCDLMAAGRR
jgi:hypothetical protein